MSLLYTASFRPAWWLRSPHLQTLWTRFNTQPRIMPSHWERVELADGDFIDLAWCNPHEQAPLILFLHGLEGSLDSHYARCLIPALNRAGFNCVFMLMRGRGREANRLERSYHSGASDDLAMIITHLQQAQTPPDAAIGVSLGGNVLLKYLGEQADRSPLRCAIAVSVPFDLAACAKRLGQGLSKGYGQYLLACLKRSFREKYKHRRCSRPINLNKINTLYQFDDNLTGPLNGFAGADDYYARCSCKPFLAKIHTPTLIIQAADDPFMGADTLPTQQELSQAVQLELAEQGGHVGFFQSTGWFSIQFWPSERISTYLKTALST